jgi:hypothetical protein
MANNLAWGGRGLTVPANHKVQGNDLIYKLSEYVEDGIRHAIATIDM